MAMICWNTPLYSCGEHEQQYIVCFPGPRACSFAGVCACEPEENVLQHSWVGVPLTWAVPFLFPWSPKCCCLPRVCLCVSANARFTHVTTAEAAALLSCFAGLRRTAAHWLLKGLCSLHAWRGWPWHSYALEHGAWGFTQQCQVRGSAQNCPCSQLRLLIKVIVLVSGGVLHFQ